MLNKISDQEVLLFGYYKEDDGPADWERQFGDMDAVYAVAADEFGVERNDWNTIPDAMEGCQKDWINPVRVKKDAPGNSAEITFEALENGEWKAI